ncbi:MAG: hypothetical protein KAU20_03980 [Nanoarchaeota archaeon]|nr:hypothetical protein [Nanoarchaeota archaeon]
MKETNIWKKIRMSKKLIGGIIGLGIGIVLSLINIVLDKSLLNHLFRWKFLGPSLFIIIETTLSGLLLTWFYEKLFFKKEMIFKILFLIIVIAIITLTIYWWLGINLALAFMGFW